MTSSHSTRLSISSLSATTHVLPIQMSETWEPLPAQIEKTRTWRLELQSLQGGWNETIHIGFLSRWPDALRNRISILLANMEILLIFAVAIRSSSSTITKISTDPSNNLLWVSVAGHALS